MSDWCDTVRGRTVHFRAASCRYVDVLKELVNHLNARASVDNVSTTGKSNKGLLATWHREFLRLQKELVPLRDEMLRVSEILVDLASVAEEQF